MLVLEEMEKIALTHVEEGKQAELVAKKKELTIKGFARLKLKPAHETSTRYSPSLGWVGGWVWLSVWWGEVQRRLDTCHQRYLSSQHFYSRVPLCNSETASWSKVEEVVFHKKARRVAF